MAAKITRKALNRATLDRQFLLRRTNLPLEQALEHLVGLQAQTTTSWYHGMWTRVADFDPYALSELLSNRSVVRMVLMRGTIHLVTAEDALFLRPLTQVVSTRAFQLPGLDYDEVIRVGRGLVEDKPMIFSELGKHLAKQWPDHDPSKLAHVVRAHVPLV
ncbi:DNA glycosylase AlkZ-like family protein, partial [Kibdelosporangium lantanae]